MDAGFCGMSLLAPAKPAASSLEFLPLFFGVSLPRAGAYTGRKYEGTRAL